MRITKRISAYCPSTTSRILTERVDHEIILYFIYVTIPDDLRVNLKIQNTDWGKELLHGIHFPPGCAFTA